MDNCREIDGIGSVPRSHMAVQREYSGAIPSLWRSADHTRVPQGNLRRANPLGNWWPEFRQRLGAHEQANVPVRGKRLDDSVLRSPQIFLRVENLLLRRNVTASPASR